MMGIYFLGGDCDEIKGPERRNMPPTVEFVNIPVAGAKFSSDTTIYWNGSDVDGFIKYYRYAVIESLLVGSSPFCFLNLTSEEEIDWDTVVVGLDDPGTSHRISMSADTLDPVRKYKASYIFLQAIDNLGARSEIAYRMFRKNNHFPNTRVFSNRLRDPYVNVVSPGGVLEGVGLSWAGTDSIDYPRNPPPFEYRWKVYGPYTEQEMFDIEANYVGSVFVDIYGDYYFLDDCYPIDDTTCVPIFELGRSSPYGTWEDILYMDTVVDANPPITNSYFPIPEDMLRLIESSYDPLSGGDWVTDEEYSFYDLYRYHPVDTTSQYFFLFWCQSRDDSRVADRVAAFNWFSVIEPKFEREVLVIDANSYQRTSLSCWNWPRFPAKAEMGVVDYWEPDVVPLIKETIGEMVNTWKDDPNAFDIDNILDRRYYIISTGQEKYIDYPRFHATQDYYPVVPLTRPWMQPPDDYIMPVTLREMLKHKTIILVKDDVGPELVMESAQMLAVIDAMNAGLGCWSMVRCPFKSFRGEIYPTWQSIPISYMGYFGVLAMRHTAWLGNINNIDDFNVRVEDFVGANIIGASENPNLDGFPRLPLDTTILENEYVWIPGQGLYTYPFRCPIDNSVLIGALPEVGYVKKMPYAQAMYVYDSEYGHEATSIKVDVCGVIDLKHHEKYQGAVVGLRTDRLIFRSAHFSFTLLPIQRDSAQVTFNKMMDWLSERTIISSGAGRLAIDGGASVNTDFSDLRQITRDLHERQRQGTLRSFVPDGNYFDE
jgi:hypothetical protein